MVKHYGESGSDRISKFCCAHVAKRGLFAVSCGQRDLRSRDLIWKDLLRVSKEETAMQDRDLLEGDLGFPPHGWLSVVFLILRRNSWISLLMALRCFVWVTLSEYKSAVISFG
jgi:hypothetical protein